MAGKNYKDPHIVRIETDAGVVEIMKKDEVEDMEQEAELSQKKVDGLGDLPGVGPATIEKLESAGYADLMSVAVATPGELVGAAEMSEATAKKVIAIARSNVEIDFATGDDLLRKREQVMKIKTGSEELDKLFGGGVETASITEAYGQFGAGKSQLAHVLAVRCQLPVEKGGCGEDTVAVWIDTEGTFRPERIKQISEGQGLDYETVLKNIKVARAFNSDHQALLGEKVEDLIKKQGMDVRVVIVDGLMSHFRSEFVGRGTLADRQQKINKHMHALIKIADRYNLAVYVTNQVMSKPDMFFGDPTAAIGGNIVGHNSTYRVYLRRGKKGTRVAKMVDSPSLPESEAVFMVDEKGIRDA